MDKTFLRAKKSGINYLIYGMSIAYLLFLIWAILWKCSLPFFGGTERTINLLPFNNNTSWEMQFNIIVFVPFGFYLASAKRGRELVKQIFAIFLLSVMLETAQFVFAIGHCDVTDLLMNAFGGIIGIAVFYGLSKLFGRHERKMTAAICILLTLLELYMTASFILFGQLNIGFMIVRL